MANDLLPGAQIAANFGETFTITWRTGITSSDAAVTDLTSAGFGASGLVDTRITRSIEVKALANTAGDTLTCKVISYNKAGVPTDESGVLTFVSDATDTVAGAGQRFPSQSRFVAVGDAAYVKVKIISLGAGVTWDVGCRPE